MTSVYSTGTTTSGTIWVSGGNDKIEESPEAATKRAKQIKACARAEKKRILEWKNNTPKYVGKFVRIVSKLGMNSATEDGQVYFCYRQSEKNLTCINRDISEIQINLEISIGTYWVVIESFKDKAELNDWCDFAFEKLSKEIFGTSTYRQVRMVVSRIAKAAKREMPDAPNPHEFFPTIQNGQIVMSKQMQAKIRETCCPEWQRKANVLFGEMWTEMFAMMQPIVEICRPQLEAVNHPFVRQIEHLPKLELPEPEKS